MYEDKSSARKAIAIMVTYAGVVAIGIFAIPAISKYIENPEIMTCAFTLDANGKPLFVPYSQVRVGNAEISGELSNPFEDMWTVEGDAIVSLNGKEVSQGLHGRVFLSLEGTVQAMSLNFGNWPYEENGLSISTLNSDGILDNHTKRAFFYYSRSSTSHPASYECKTRRYRDN